MAVADSTRRLPALSPPHRGRLLRTRGLWTHPCSGNRSPSPLRAVELSADFLCSEETGNLGDGAVRSGAAACLHPRHRPPAKGDRWVPAPDSRVPPGSTCKVSPFPVCKRRPKMCTQQRASFLGRLFARFPSSGSQQVPGRPTRDSAAGFPRTRGLCPPFPASSPAAGLRPRHSGGRREHPGSATGRVLAWGWRRMGDHRPARGAGCAEEGAPGRARGAGRLQHHGQGAQSPSAAGWSSWRNAVLSGAFLECPPGHLQTRFCLTSCGSLQAGSIQSRCKENAAGREESPVLAVPTTRPLLLSPAL